MFTIAGTYILISVTMFFWLVPDPKEVGIEMEKEEATYFYSDRSNEIRAQGY